MIRSSRRMDALVCALERDVARWLERGAFKIQFGAGFQRMDLAGNMYDKFNASKWLQDCMLSIELKWRTNERSSDQGGGGGGGGWL